MPGHRGGQIFQGDRLFKIGFWWVIGSIVVLMTLTFLLFLGITIGRWPESHPLLYYWIPIVGFGIMGVTFYLVFARHNINPIVILNKNSRKLFFYCLMFVVITVVFFEIMFMFLLISLFHNVMNWDVYEATMDILIILSPLFRLFMYIAIIVIGLAFNKITNVMFGPGHMRMQLRFNPRFITNIALVVGFFACISQAVGLILVIFGRSGGLDDGTFPIHHLGSDFFLVTGNIPHWLGTLLIALYLVIILMVTMNSIPIHYQHLFIGKLMRMDIQSIFRFSLILIVVSSILRMVTGVIMTWQRIFDLGMEREWLFGPPFQDVFIVNMYYLARFLSPLFFFLGFALICLCFHHIFRAREFEKLAQAGKPT